METSAASPAKRRALAPIDANSKSPSCATRVPGKLASPLKRALVSSEGSSETSSGRDKKACLDSSPTAPSRAGNHQNDRVSSATCTPQRIEGARAAVPAPSGSRACSPSPEPADSADSSMFFDQSSLDITQVTNITEPDNDARTEGTGMTTTHSALLSSPPPPRRRRAMTREEARVKAEMLRLRLGLASYKVKTGQTEVPLERLQRKPFASAQGARSSRARSNSSAAAISMARNAMRMADTMSTCVQRTAMAAANRDDGEQGAVPTASQEQRDAVARPLSSRSHDGARTIETIASES
ncbi:uncharacterized protein B0I36DRAFT_22201 [Microdochium trichocladiopsis]|uniref:Cyclin-dependent kinase n=1 Tax=Microdochium trichocladiopsis TaxID=1682393 RepID=A0A9P8YLS2_9PEZI|nr:uncharacterized protein B0I36DRAFT_22201 [Microdochium trichocladiopsis]KAH7041335.1 hypothetical protein B0I36DRAFT_22201 [Microdochium trichocladiopsis]